MTNRPPHPVVSIVVPMLDERSYIERCIDGFEQQTYGSELLDVIVVDGGSRDGSRELVEALARTRPWLRVIDNPQRRAAAAFNRGIEAAKGDVVCLVAAHGEVGTDYVERSVRALVETDAAGVGGVLRHEGLDAPSVAIGLAMTSPFGMASPFRYSTTRRHVDTIGHPAYWRSALDDVGPFDETLERNSDYELNHRLRRAGFALLFDPEIVTVYRPRTTLSNLARQFFSYGRAKAQVIQRQPTSLKPRHLVPPAMVTFLALSPLAVRRPAGRRIVLAAFTAYAAMLFVATRRAEPRRHDADAATFVAALPTMHVAWGSGFVYSVLRRFR
jgi:succinoglycan biosynthesis protein ExoA